VGERVSHPEPVPVLTYRPPAKRMSDCREDVIASRRLGRAGVVDVADDGDANRRHEWIGSRFGFGNQSQASGKRWIASMPVFPTVRPRGGSRRENIEGMQLSAGNRNGNPQFALNSSGIVVMKADYPVESFSGSAPRFPPGNPAKTVFPR
jgi:hypothetical protein